MLFKPELALLFTQVIYFFITSQDVPKDFDIKSKIEEILTTLEADKLRARTMDIDDFMKVLHAFNSAGIHFS